ncbi:ABC transporter substrate-binding protein [Methylobacter sp. Wu8]|uniref:Phospholipid transport system substrate-binding protein n=1 Tax=Methylobacter tundripaludum TaxID=173365 RepID=A0A2S6GZQ7_9GAMM|nr:ABC transporter substrate-binding protein [Methylobacter tundripaludum]MCF7966294.1 ABC transporter substrate-binding protein [Methylobacter tundripaludum]MCK9634758.1 ABC transporter substrate-binding protein [Methylobacter tundripaludum]PPK70698.1 phospholipid transport system substrate-binding protein [Methylobacter tundripaludum]
MVFKSVRLAIAFAFFLFGTTSAFAMDEGAATAKQVVEKFQADLINVMKEGKKLGYAGRYEKLKDPISNSHELNKIARIVVGKEWEKLSEEQQQKLVDVFSRLSIASYAHNFKDYSGESFVFDSEEETTRGGVVLHSHLVIPGDKPVKFDYMLKEKGSSWRIINIIANGVSDLALKRSEYTTILQREGFDALMAKINEKIDNYSKQ